MWITLTCLEAKQISAWEVVRVFFIFLCDCELSLIRETEPLGKKNEKKKHDRQPSCK